MGPDIETGVDLMTYEIFGLPRGWSRQRRDLFPVAALVLAGIGAACAPGKVIVPGQTCATDKDCAAGALCLDRVCTKPCVANTDCPNGNEACTEGRCQVVPDAECIVGGDCVAPLPCFTTQGVTCVAGRCGYPPESQGTPCDDGNPCTDPDTCSATHVCGGPARLCNQPDPPFCVDDVDGPYRYYEPIGTCNDTTGDCEYTPVDQPCANCAETCLQRCAGMFCNDLSGGCRLGGVCVPDDPAWCLYTIAPDGIMCDLPQSPLGSNDGMCAGGMCVECVVQGDCTAPPTAWPVCFVDTCDAGVCTYTVQPISECMPSGCAGNVETLARVCGADGACADKGTVSCNGLRCDSANLHCLTSGTSDSDCLEGLYFKTDGTCAPIINDGGSCVGQGDHACASGHCNGSLCCAVGADCCNVPSDCPASYTVLSSCNDNSTATDCQGTAEIPTCIGNVCGKQVDDDDRGCVDLLHTCPGNLAPRKCMNTKSQLPPACPSGCSVATDCAFGYTCQSPNCIVPVGAGQSCTGTGQGTCAATLKCQNGVCCSAASPGACCDPSITPPPCLRGLACDPSTPSTYSCLTTCNDYTTASCADPTTTSCLSNQCVSKLAGGSPCVSDNQCQSAHCVESVCCDSVCAATCQSCLVSLNGVASGLCRPILANLPDSDPSPLCTSSGIGCSGGGNCACDGLGATGADCRLARGQPCAADGDCATGLCECADAICAARVCSSGDCQCKVENSLGTTCTSSNVTAGYQTVDCKGTHACKGDGTCVTGSAVAVACAADGGCASGACECTDPTCTAKVCSSTDCQCKVENGTGTTCTSTDVTAGYQTADCKGLSACNGNGACSVGSAIGVACNADSACASGFCECTDATCSAKVCAAANCSCKLESGSGTTCNSTSYVSMGYPTPDCAAGCTGAGA